MQLVAVAALLLVSATSPQSALSIDAATANAMAAQAAAEAQGDAAKAVEIFTALAKAEIGEFYPFPPEIFSNNDISIVAVPPLALVASELKETLRKFEPLSELTMLPGVGILVKPLTINAPKIIKVVVHRDGRLMQPIATTLSETVLQNAFGAHFDSSSGLVVFPMEAFRPGAAVTVTAVPSVGENIVVRMPAHLLKHLH